MSVLEEFYGDRDADKKTHVELLSEVEFILPNRPEDEQQVSIPRYECKTCGWQFWGDCARGLVNGPEGVQTPNYCPMCGRKIANNYCRI